MQFSFVSTWVDHWTHPGNCFSWQIKTIQSLWVKGIKLIMKKPFLKGRYEHPQHNNNLLLLVKNNITTFFNLLLSDLSIIYLLFIGKNNKQIHPIFLHTFCSFSPWYPVALGHTSKWKMVGKNFGLEWHTIDQDSHIFYGYVPVANWNCFQN